MKHCGTRMADTADDRKMLQLAALEGKVGADMLTNEDLDISRFEYITEDGREVVSYAKHTFQLQDDMRTLKVFREKE